MRRAERRLDICTYILGDDAFGEEVTAASDRLRRARRAGALPDRRRRRHLAAAILVQAHAGSRRRDRGILAAPRAQDSGPAEPAQSPQMGDRRRRAALERRAQSRRGVFLRRARRRAVGRSVVRSRGPVAASAANQFESDWIAAGGKPAARAAVAAEEDAAGRAQFLPSGPDQTEDTVRALLIDACFHATERMLAVTPYFVPDASLETAMRLAARRGVKIDLCIPAKSNHRLADFVRNRALRALVERRRVHPSAAWHEPCKGRGVRPQPRALRLAQSRFAQPSPQL